MALIKGYSSFFFKTLLGMLQVFCLMGCETPKLIESPMVAHGECVECSLYFANYAHHNLDGIDLRGATLRGADLRGSSLKKANLKGVSLGQSTLNHAQMDGAEIDGIDLEQSSLAYTILDDSKGRFPLFPHVNLEQSSFKNAAFIAPSFLKAHGSKVHFENSRLIFAYFGHADLRGSHFDGAYIPRGHFQNGTFTGSSFRGAFLMNADFSHADLGGADFRGANLTGATFVGANLSGAQFEDAILEDTNLCHATSAVGDRVDYCDKLLSDLQVDRPKPSTHPSVGMPHDPFSVQSSPFHF